MFNFKIVVIITGLLLFFAPVSLTHATMSSTNYQIFADVFSTGGGINSSSTNYALDGTLGEPIIQSATSTSATYGIKAGFQEMYPDNALSFSLGSTSIDLGELDSSAVKSTSHTMTVSTNAVAGFQVTVSGNTLESGANSINAIGSTAAASAVGTEQFGINLVANTAPSVGSDPSGTSPIGSAADQFNTADSFAFNDAGANTVATSSAAINSTSYTVSYIANIGTGTESGTYTTTLTYSATANF